jgi:hypothetical protein
MKRRVKTHTAITQDSSTPVPWRWRSRAARIGGLQGTSPGQLGQGTEGITLPGSPERALSASTAADLSDWLFSLALAWCSPLPSGPLPLMPFVLRYPCTGAAAAAAPLAGALSITSSPSWRAFRRSALTCFSFICASYSSWLRRTYVIPRFSAR